MQVKVMRRLFGLQNTFMKNILAMGPALVVLGRFFTNSSTTRAWSNQDYTAGYTDPQSRSLIGKTVRYKISPIMFYLIICKQNHRETGIFLN